MPTGKKITVTQRKEIMVLHYLDLYTQFEIAEKLSIGASTISRIIKQELAKKTNSKQQNTISIAASMADHALITEYANERNLPKHEALHELLHDHKDQFAKAIEELSSGYTKIINQIETLSKNKPWKLWR